MNKKRRLFAGILAVLLCFSLAPSSALAASEGRIFPDVPAGAPYADALDTLYEMGIFEGDEHGNFNPDKTISRAELATILCRILEAEEEAKTHTSAPFTDVRDGVWYAGYVFMAAGMGIVTGYGNGLFGPNDPVKYEQAVTMLVRAWGYDWMAKDAGGYPDGYLSVARSLGFLNNVSGSVGSPAPRSTVAQLVYNMLQTEQFFET